LILTQSAAFGDQDSGVIFTPLYLHQVHTIPDSLSAFPAALLSPSTPQYGVFTL